VHRPADDAVVLMAVVGVIADDVLFARHGVRLARACAACMLSQLRTHSLCAAARGGAGACAAAALTMLLPGLPEGVHWCCWWAHWAFVCCVAAVFRVTVPEQLLLVSTTANSQPAATISLPPHLSGHMQR
jgi:hypothetical protein